MARKVKDDDGTLRGEETVLPSDGTDTPNEAENASEGESVPVTPLDDEQGGEEEGSEEPEAGPDTLRGTDPELAKLVEYEREVYLPEVKALSNIRRPQHTNISPGEIFRPANEKEFKLLLSLKAVELVL
jgi:hypothetical protein